VAHTCNLSYSESTDQEDRSSSQHGKIVPETLSQKTFHKNWTSEVAHGEGYELKHHHQKKKKKKRKKKEKSIIDIREIKCRVKKKLCVCLQEHTQIHITYNLYIHMNI
jgi:uncharacterized membrane protein YkoI